MVSNEKIQEMKDLLEKKGGKEVSWEEASDASYRLSGFVELMFDCWKEDKRREKKLEEFPNGFILDSHGYTCAICHNGTAMGQNWYDKYGIKCTICQEAINKKEIPPSLAKNRDSWYSSLDLQSSFNVDRHGLNRWIKQGIIKARTVSYNGKGVHCLLFLIKDNKGFLPPKKLVDSKLVSETDKDGKTYHHSEPWYKFVDPHEYLKGYKIMDHLRAIKVGEEDEKQ